MKKLLSFIFILVTAIFSNLDYVRAPDKIFDENLYYQGSSSESSYKDLYEDYYESKINVESCNSKPLQPTSTDVRIVPTSASFTWLKTGEDFTEDIHFKSGDEVIAPCRVKVYNESSASANSTKLCLVTDSGQFEIVFENLKCWWCCAKKTSSGPYEHTLELKGTILPEGSVVGIATEDTTVTIYKVGQNGYFSENISLKQFYGIKEE